jgi:AraC family transcriptional regulator
VRHLRTSLLLDSPIVRVTDVACHAPQCGPGAEEGAGEQVVLVVPRRGVFCVHRGSHGVAADPNSVLLLGGGLDYRVSHPAAGGDDCTTLLFAPELAEEALGSSPAPHGLASPAAQLRAATLTAALARGTLEPLAAEEAALGLLAELAPSLNRAATPAPLGAAGLRRVESVRWLLAADPGAAWRLEGVARAVHCSPFHLARQFRAATGETIARYLLRLRLAAAAHRIAAGEDKLARLAVELGFSHHSHLSARFRAAFRVTPSEARRIVTAPAAGAP